MVADAIPLIHGIERLNKMITGELKNKIDSLWNIFAAGGLVNIHREVLRLLEVKMDIEEMMDDYQKIYEEKICNG